MLIAGIFLILILTTLASYVMKKRKVRLGYVWLVLGFSAFAIWLALSLTAADRISPFVIQEWFRFGESQLELNFQFNQTNWAVIFALISLHTGFLFVAATQPKLNRDFKLWIVAAGEIALSFAIFASANLLTVILTWTALDVSSLLYQILIQGEWESDDIFFSFVIKLAGSLLLIFTNAELVGSGQSTLLENLPVSSSTSLFFSAILHSGILPFQPFKKGERLIGTILNYFNFFLPFITSLFLLTFLPGTVLPLIPKLFLSLLFLIIAFYFIFRWMNDPEELSGIHNFLISFMGMMAYRFLTGSQNSAGSWFIVAFIVVNFLLFFDRRGKSLILFSILIMLSLTGLPFTLINYGRVGMITSSLSISSILLISYHIMFNLGYVRFLLRKKKNFEELENSYQTIYLAGLSLIVLSIGVITFRSLGSLLDEISFWWVGIFITAISAGIHKWRIRRENEGKQSGMSGVLWEERVLSFLSFRWIFGILDYLIQFLRTMVSVFSQILEGEGGVLWSIVFLALLFTLLKIG